MPNNSIWPIPSRKRGALIAALSFSLPMTATTAPISTATEQEQHQHDDQDQFHGVSPLTARALMRQGS
jgi:hypothetical protein